LETILFYRKIELKISTKNCYFFSYGTHISICLGNPSSWSKIPEKLVFYDYIGNNPAKGDYSEQAQWTMGME
jgi:hypothetical protein